MEQWMTIQIHLSVRKCARVFTQALICEQPCVCTRMKHVDDSCGRRFEAEASQRLEGLRPEQRTRGLCFTLQLCPASERIYNL